MKFKITYFVAGMTFEAIAYGVSDAFDYVKAIVKSERNMFPNQREALDNYFAILGEMVTGKCSAFSSGSGLFEIKLETV